MSQSAFEVYGRLLLALAIPFVGFFVLGMTGFFPFLIVSEGTLGGLVFVGACAAIGAGICWVGRRSGVLLLIGLLFLGLAVWCGVGWLRAAL